MVEVEEGSTVKDVFDDLVKNLGKKFVKFIYNPTENKISKHSLVILNDKDVNLLKGLETRITNGDNIIFIPAIAGG